MHRGNAIKPEPTPAALGQTEEATEATEEATEAVTEA